MWTVYIIQCQNGTYYTGLTGSFNKRYQKHNQGKGGCYTRYNRPWRVVYKKSFENRLLAEKREQQIKRWSRSKKLALIENDIKKLVVLSKSRD